MKERIDILLTQKFGISRSKAQALIEEGLVKAGDKIVEKASLFVDKDAEIQILPHKDYVSRGAHKLLGAISAFSLNLTDKVVLDMGSSTGGFTQVALEHGASKVYAVDIGQNELDKALATNSRVVKMEGRDIRTLKKQEVADTQLVVGDLSFISLKHILPKINELFGKIQAVLLFKPQFECGKDIARKYKGVIKDKAIHIKLLKEFLEELKLYDWKLCNLTYSPIKGKSGNIEYLLHLNARPAKLFDIQQIVQKAFDNL